MRPAKTILIGLCTIAVFQFGAPQKALANCAAYFYNVISEDTGHVIVCGDGLSCEEGDVLIRHDVATGEAVELSGNCISQIYQSCFLDECLPSGNYRFGSTQPLACGCGFQEFYKEYEHNATVENCETTSNGQPPLWKEAIPWGEKSSQKCSNFGCSTTVSPAHFGFPAFTIVALIGCRFLISRRRKTRV